MNKKIRLYSLVITAFALIAIFTSNSYDSSSQEEASAVNVGDLPQQIRPVDLDRPFDLAGERVPMDNFDVRERLDRELLVNSYWQSSTLLNIKRTTRYFPIIEKILAKNGIPDDFKYLAVAESDLMNGSSHAGAKGVWQFMENTGEFYGLEINKEVDERYHIEKATEAACQYIEGYKKRFGNWTMAAAAYNVGGTRLAKEVEEQKATSYYDLNLYVETSRYVFRVIALKEILSRPKDFGYYVEAADMYPPLDDYDIVKVEGAIESLADFAQQHNVSYRLLKVYNPWLRSGKLTNASRKTYEIKIPRKKL